MEALDFGVHGDPVDKAFLKKVVLHCTAEMMHLDEILPEVSAEYYDQPIDAD